jgi:hypothetical protein
MKRAMLELTQTRRLFKRMLRTSHDFGVRRAEAPELLAA